MEKLILVLLLGFSFLLIVKIKKLTNENKKLNSLWYLLRNSRDVIYSIRVDGVPYYEYLSPSLSLHLGEVEAKKHHEDPMYLLEAIHPEDAYLIEKKLKGDLDFTKPLYLRVKTDTGNYIWFEEFITPLYENGQLVQMYAIFRNCHSQRELQLELEEKVTMDALEGVYNRSFFEQKMQEYNEKEEQSLLLFICDLDKLKKINDSQGHIRGDEYILITSTILKNAFYEDGMICRIGGDEFAVFVPNVEEKEVQSYINKIEQEIDRLSYVNNLSSLSISIGFSYRKSTYNQTMQMYKEADEWMYRQKLMK